MSRINTALAIIQIKQIQQLGDELMAVLDGINAALDSLGTQIQKVADELAATDPSDITQEQLDAVVDRINGFADAVDALTPNTPSEPAPSEPSGETPAEPPAEA